MAVRDIVCAATCLLQTDDVGTRSAHDPCNALEVVHTIAADSGVDVVCEDSDHPQVQPSSARDGHDSYKMLQVKTHGEVKRFAA